MTGLALENKISLDSTLALPNIFPERQETERGSLERREYENRVFNWPSLGIKSYLA